MRVGLFVVSAIVGGASVAYAQSDWVVDPWVSSSEPQVSSVEHASAAALAPASHGHLRFVWIDEPNFDLADPWARPAAVEPLGNAQAHPSAPRAVSAPGVWAKPVPLVVDPWAAKAAKSRVSADDLIVDPWAYDDPGR